MSETKTIKVNFDSDIRRLGVPAKIPFVELYDIIRKLFGFEVFVLKVKCLTTVTNLKVCRR
jgi:hypothetical protein